MPVLDQPGAEMRLRDYWLTARRMGEVLARVPLGETSLSCDVGGGLTTPLRWLPGRRVCVDPLAEEYAARFGLPLDRVMYMSGQGEALPFVTSTCDLVICTNCVDHTDDPWAVVAEVERVLRPGGWFWFTCEEYPAGHERNAGHPHALDRAAIRRLVDDFEIACAWEEPWRGAYGYLLDLDPHPTTEFGFLVRKPGRRNAV